MKDADLRQLLKRCTEDNTRLREWLADAIELMDDEQEERSKWQAAARVALNKRDEEVA